MSVLDALLDSPLRERFAEERHPRDWKGRFKALSVLKTMRPGDVRRIEGVKVERGKNGDYTVHHPATSARGRNPDVPNADANLASPGVAVDSLAGALKSKHKSKVREASIDLLLAAPVQEVFTETKHKRGAKGTSQGGKFISTGSSGSDVQRVQRKVGAKTDGSFGYATRAAVMAYQRKHGLKVDGVVGHQTAAAMRGQKNAKRVKTGALTHEDRKALGSKSAKKPTSTSRKGTAPTRPRHTVTPRERASRSSRQAGGIVA